MLGRLFAELAEFAVVRFRTDVVWWHRTQRIDVIADDAEPNRE